MKRVMILEDELTSKMILESALSQYDLIICESIKEAMEAHDKKPADFYILDIHLPDGTVFPFIQKIMCEKPAAGIYVASSESQLENHLRSIKMGALDFFEKPFNPLVLKAKLNNYFERNKLLSPKEEIELSGLKIDSSRLSVLDINNKTYLGPFTKTEFKILELLLQNEGRVMSREQILRACVGELHNSTPRAVDTHIAKIRKKLGSFAEHIKSAHGLGYRFI